MSKVAEKYAEILEEYGEDIPKKKVVALLTLADFTAKEIDEVVPKRKRGTSFRSDYYDWLVEGSRTEEEAKEFIAENGTDNDRRHEGHHLGIWKLAERIREI